MNNQLHNVFAYRDFAYLFTPRQDCWFIRDRTSVTIA